MAERERIEVEISATESMKIRNELMWESYVVGKLKAAGVPIIGTLLYGGLESGTLYRLDDPCDFDKCKYVWVPNVEVRGRPLLGDPSSPQG